MPALFFATLSGAVFFILIASVRGELLHSLFCTFPEYLLVLLKATIVAASWICVFYAMRELPISLASPIRSTSPLWTMLGGILIFGEIPGWLQAGGIVMIFCGYFLFGQLGKREGFSFRSKGMKLIILGTLLGAASALYDKFLLNIMSLDRQMVQMYFSINLVLVLGSFTLLRNIFGNRHRFIWKWTIPVTGMLITISDFSYFYGVSQPDAPISMISLVRRCSCVVSFFLGALIFRDKNIKEKALALILLLGGAALLALAK